MQLLVQNYHLVDRRYSPLAPSGERAFVLLVSIVEIVGHSPLCLAAYIGIALRRPWRHEAQLLALSLQLIGTVLFAVPELMTGCVNMAPAGAVGCTPAVSMYTLLFFYFGSCVSTLWVVIPGVMIWRTTLESATLKTRKAVSS